MCLGQSFVIRLDRLQDIVDSIVNLLAAIAKSSSILDAILKSSGVVMYFSFAVSSVRQTRTWNDLISSFVVPAQLVIH